MTDTWYFFTLYRRKCCFIQQKSELVILHRRTAKNEPSISQCSNQRL